MSTPEKESAEPQHDSTSTRPREPMPKGIFNIYVFEVFNTISWTVVLGAPMLLFLKHLNATTTLLALASSMSPVLNVLQLPAARFVDKIGYKKLVLSGWTARSFLIVGMAIVAFLPDYVDRTTRVTFFFVFCLLYNVLRGFSVCGMLPWFTHLVPESRRGEFLAKDQFASALASVASMMAYAYILTGKNNDWYVYGLLFSISAASAFFSLRYLHRTPDVPVESVPNNVNPRPWKEMLLYPPFFRYMTYNMVINFASGVGNVFWVPMFRDARGVSQSGVLLAAGGSTVVLAGALFCFGSLIDRVGNKPMLILSGICMMVHYFGWAAINAGIIPFNNASLCWQCFTAGIGVALWNLSNLRMVIGIVPVMGRAHFLALYSVIFNLTFGIAPLMLAPAMDYLVHVNWHRSMGGWSWNPYSTLYILLTSVMLVGLLLLRRIHEPGSMTWDAFMAELIKTPTRGVSRLIGRWRGTGMGG